MRNEKYPITDALHHDAPIEAESPSNESGYARFSKKVPNGSKRSRGSTSSFLFSCIITIDHRDVEEEDPS